MGIKSKTKFTKPTTDDSRHEWLSSIAIIETASEMANEKLAKNTFSDEDREIYFGVVRRNLNRLKNAIQISKKTN